jgi:hypothetical protein
VCGRGPSFTLAPGVPTPSPAQQQCLLERLSQDTNALSVCGVNILERLNTNVSCMPLVGDGWRGSGQLGYSAPCI